MDEGDLRTELVARVPEGVDPSRTSFRRGDACALPADLGQFDRVSMKLRPGKYVAAGTRSGFRDVRVEFTVTGETSSQQVVVRCEEPIS